jgi:hypothetical protein
MVNSKENRRTRHPNVVLVCEDKYGEDVLGGLSGRHVIHNFNEYCELESENIKIIIKS